MDKVFVIANGESRKNFDVNRLWSYGKVIGINAIYRENPKIDYLVGVDIQMMNEVGEANYTDAEVWTYPRQQIKQAIDHLVSEGTIKIEKFIGEREGYTTAHGMVFNGREGVIATTNKQ